MAIFSLPEGLLEIAHFAIPRVETWGKKQDNEFKAYVRECANIDAGQAAEWFVFCIRCKLRKSRGEYTRQTPDVENIPKLIVDAFSGHLYDDDNLHFVRGVQVEAEWCEDESDQTEVIIYGSPRNSSTTSL